MFSALSVRNIAPPIRVKEDQRIPLIKQTQSWDPSFWQKDIENRLPRSTAIIKKL